jgi:hypothetical protein
MYYAFNEDIVYFKNIFFAEFSIRSSAQNLQISKRPIIREGILRSDENTLCLTQVFTQFDDDFSPTSFLSR